MKGLSLGRMMASRIMLYRVLRGVKTVSGECKELAKTEPEQKAICQPPEPCGKEICPDPKTVHTFYEAPKSLRVTVLGAVDPVGQILGLHLKMNKKVKDLRLHDAKGAIAVSMDLKHVNTPCHVRSFAGEHQLSNALKRCDLVVLAGGARLGTKDMTEEDVLEKNAPRVAKMAEACYKICPEAVFIIAVDPVNSTLPLFSEVLARNGLYCPNRVVGSMGAGLVLARTVAARVLGFQPETISRVDVIGGSCPQTMVPVMTTVQPCGNYLLDEVLGLVKKVRKTTEELTAIRGGTPPWLSTGYYHSVFATSVINGMCGVEGAGVTSALVRSRALPGVAYLATPVEFGPGGVTKNFGVPLLSEPEIGLLEEAIPLLEEDVLRGTAYAERLSPRPTSLDPCANVLVPSSYDEPQGVPCPDLPTCTLQSMN